MNRKEISQVSVSTESYLRCLEIVFCINRSLCLLHTLGFNWVIINHPKIVKQTGSSICHIQPPKKKKITHTQKQYLAHPCPAMKKK